MKWLWKFKSFRITKKLSKFEAQPFNFHQVIILQFDTIKCVSAVAVVTYIVFSFIKWRHLRFSEWCYSVSKMTCAVWSQDTNDPAFSNGTLFSRNWMSKKAKHCEGRTGFLFCAASLKVAFPPDSRKRLLRDLESLSSRIRTLDTNRRVSPPLHFVAHVCFTLVVTRSFFFSKYGSADVFTSTEILRGSETLLNH